MEKPKVALVLSSGGARGLAHIGVIEELEKEGFEISSIAGSSMGAIVGAFYACGKLYEYRDWVCKLDRLDVFKLIDFTFSTNGFIRGEKVFKTLKEFIPDHQIEDLPVPFCAIATDLNEKKEVVMKSGSMFEAIKASVAIPTVIKPQKYGDMELIDGGVMNPIPVDKVERTQGDILVVVNANAKIPYKTPFRNKEFVKKEEQKYLKMITEFKVNWSRLLPGNTDVKEPIEKLGYFELLNRSIDLMQDKMTDLILTHHKPEILVKVSRDAASTFEFYKAKEMIEMGRKAFQTEKKKYFDKTSNSKPQQTS
jgi:NTE family protein